MSVEREKLKKLAEAATPGPWKWFVGDNVEWDGVWGKWQEFDGFGTTEDSVITPFGNTDQTGSLGVTEANAHYLAAANPSTILALLSELEQAERERDLMKGQMNAAFETEKSDCSKALLAMVSAQKCTPAETYGSNSSWAISDLCRALKEDAAALRTLRQASAADFQKIADLCELKTEDPAGPKLGHIKKVALAAALAAEGGK